MREETLRYETPHAPTSTCDRYDSILHVAPPLVPRCNDGHLPRRTTQLELIPLRRCRRTLDSISLDLREVQLRPHRCRQAREATEAASQSLQRSGPPFWRMRVRPLHQIRYADSSEEPSSGTESGAWHETQRHWRTPR